MTSGDNDRLGDKDRFITNSSIYRPSDMVKKKRTALPIKLFCEDKWFWNE
jgi:hypothetical protein